MEEYRFSVHLYARRTQQAYLYHSATSLNCLSGLSPQMRIRPLKRILPCVILILFTQIGGCINTGGSGKHGSSDANAEFIGALRGIMQANDVTYQFSELGKVDLGGGGTIAYMCAKYCMNVIDCGVPVLSMHAPWEVISKVDLYEAYKCYCAFLKA